MLSLSVILSASPSSFPQSKQNSSWDAWQFLIGEWVSEGGGAPGQATGGFSFNLDLQGRILVRKNHADYPATKDRPAFSHDDLMIVYPESEGKPARAIYFDSDRRASFFALSSPSALWMPGEQ